MSSQCAGAVLMIRPVAFDYNPQTAATNRLQRRAAASGPAAHALADAEFEALVRVLRAEGVRVCVAQDTPQPAKPDAVFPNNWVSFHADGTVVLYPMQAVNRRLERRAAVIEQVSSELDFSVRRTLDLTHHEAEGRFLEGTGSLVLDHVNRLAYACRSERTHEALVEEWCRTMGYEPVIFDGRDRAGAPLYHTNVMLCIGARIIVVAAAAIAAADRERVLGRLGESGRELILIGHEELAGFAGNMLELGSWDEALGDCTVLVLSATARQVLRAESFARLSACTDAVLVAPVPTIEALGGGSVRCMIAEVFI
jgi:hypothetical protein